jgi:nucleotide-binding universal stress UspA family protein
MADEHPGPTRRIVVGVDGSASSTQALEWAVKQAELTASALETVITWQWPTTYGVALFLPEDYDPAADAQRVLETALGPVRQAHPAADIRPTVVEGHPALALVEASRGAELLVVGNRGHREFTGLFLGSVSEYCATAAHCPVLVFRRPQ